MASLALAPAVTSLVMRRLMMLIPEGRGDQMPGRSGVSGGIPMCFVVVGQPLETQAGRQTGEVAGLAPCLAHEY